MCAFYATQIFTHPRLSNVTYYLRLDTDSYIPEPLCYDPIDRMHTHNLSYAYRTRKMDEAKYTFRMWNAVDSYAREHERVIRTLEKNNWRWPNSRIPGPMSQADFPIYYNNFEIVRLDEFRRADIRRWFEYLESDPERIYKWRWGEVLPLIGAIR